MRISYDGKVAVVVVGATSGIGRATAVAFAEAGAKVVAAGRSEEQGAEVVREIEAAGGEAAFVRTDVTSEEQVAALMDAAVETYGALDAPSTMPRARSTWAWPTPRPRTSRARSTRTRVACCSALSTRSA
jgi:nucleoside-diphosphate-sugar epimerase